jgi:hypothetical protein
LTAKILKFPVKEKEKKERPKGIKIRFDIPNIKGIPVKLPKDGFEYLSLCKEFLAPDEYKDVLCGVLDSDHYRTIAPELRKVVDSYHKLK